MPKCKYGDPFCPCQDGDQCHYEGEKPMKETKHTPGPWNHSICETCWNARNPEREAIKLREEFRDERPDTCCFCGKLHGSGIYIRHEPAELLCKGNHPE